MTNIRLATRVGHDWPQAFLRSEPVELWAHLSMIVFGISGITDRQLAASLRTYCFLGSPKPWASGCFSVCSWGWQNGLVARCSIGQNRILRNDLGHNKSLDASGITELVIDNLSVTWSSPAASTQPLCGSHTEV